MADRKSPATIMTFGEGVRVASLVALLLLTATGQITLWTLALIGMVGSVGTLAYTVGAPTAVPRLVNASGLAGANARIELYRSVAFASGPALAGALVGQVGTDLAFLAAISLSMIALMLINSLPTMPSTNQGRDQPLRQITEGARFVRDHIYLRPIVLTAVIFNTAWFCFQGVYVAYAVARLGMTADQIGLTLALYGAGMIVGTQISGALLLRRSFGMAVVIGPVFGAMASLVIMATLIVPSIALPAIAFFMLGMGPIIWSISTTTLRQAVTPAPMLGRVTALVVTSTAGFRPVGAGLGALAVLLGGYELALGISTLGFLAQAIVILRSPAVRIASLADVTERSGP
jgi:predicted MFS family arabinose efflux permease